VRKRRIENVLRPTKPRTTARREPATADPPAKAAESASGASPRSSSPSPEHQVPEHIRERFTQVGRKYYFPDGARAFTDRGKRLTTASENTEVIRSLVAIARARGWDDIAVSGTERFRKEAWFEAKLAGLKVRGYRATEFEQERLARAAGRREQSRAHGSPETSPEGTRPAAVAEPKAPRPEQERQDRLLSGRLVDHGRSTYRHDPQEPISYFVKIETERGERTLWGIDLERAFKESLTRPQLGDAVGLRAIRKDAVTVKTPERDANGHLIGEKDLQTHRNRWVIEKREFFDARATAAETIRNAAIAPRAAVKEHPELAGTYLYLRGAEEIARRRIRDPQDQRRFVDTVRGALAESVAHGEPLPTVRLRERSVERPERKPIRNPEPAPTR
jgi:putative DNA primase/helicase